jgi:hypothetical protein
MGPQIIPHVLLIQGYPSCHCPRPQSILLTQCPYLLLNASRDGELTLSASDIVNTPEFMYTRAPVRMSGCEVPGRN